MIVDVVGQNSTLRRLRLTTVSRAGQDRVPSSTGTAGSLRHLAQVVIRAHTLLTGR